MSQNMVIAGAIATFATLVAIEVFRSWRGRSRAPRVGSVPGSIPVRVVELSDTLAVQIFQRPGGSFGYYYLRKDADDGSDHWSGPVTNMGSGSAYDTADRAEELARANATGES